LRGLLFVESNSLESFWKAIGFDLAYHRMDSLPNRAASSILAARRFAIVTINAHIESFHAEAAPVTVAMPRPCSSDRVRRLGGVRALVWRRVS
jgi:hypothetical protein